MMTLEQPTTTLWRPPDAMPFDEAQLAAAAFLARYSGRTLDAYRHDLRAFFQWASDNQLLVLNATRPHIELYRVAMEERGLAASTIDRRLSTVCGFYRFAHIDGRIASNPAQYVRRPKVPPSESHGMDRADLGTFLFTAERFDRDHAALVVLLGLNGVASVSPPPSRSCSRTARTIDLVVGERHEGPTSWSPSSPAADALTPQAALR
jgi:integrase/recombinase XerD